MRTIWRYIGSGLACALLFAAVSSADARPMTGRWSLAQPPLLRLAQVNPEQMREVLDLAGLTDMALVDSSVTSILWTEAQHVWTDGAGIVGAMFDIPVEEQAQFGDRISVFLEELENGCATTPAITLADRTENAAGNYVRRFAAECVEAEQTFHTRGFFFGGTNAVVAFVHVGDGPARDRVIAVDEALYRTMYAIMGG